MIAESLDIELIQAIERREFKHLFVWTDTHQFIGTSALVTADYLKLYVEKPESMSISIKRAAIVAVGYAK